VRADGLRMGEASLCYLAGARMSLLGLPLLRMSPPCMSLRRPSAQPSASTLPLLAGALLSLSAACQKPDPGPAQAQAYVAALSPILVDNARLAREMTTLAGEVKQNRTDAPQIAGRLEKALVPAAKQVAEHAGALDTPHPALKAAHAELVESWQDRAATYEDLAQAWKDQDLDGIERAMDEIDAWRSRQDRSIEALNTAVSAYGMPAVEAYPPIAAAAPAAAGG
jgi:hypothetical protein